MKILEHYSPPLPNIACPQASARVECVMPPPLPVASLCNNLSQVKDVISIMNPHSASSSMKISIWWTPQMAINM